MTSPLQILEIPKDLADSSAESAVINRIPVTDISPSVFFGGELVPVKAIAGEEIEVTATIFREGHDALGADVLPTRTRENVPFQIDDGGRDAR